jgi:hypothetical protein
VGIPDASQLNRLAGITQPTLVANGVNDRMIPTINSQILADTSRMSGSDISGRIAWIPLPAPDVHVETVPDRSSATSRDATHSRRKLQCQT